MNFLKRLFPLVFLMLCFCGKVDDLKENKNKEGDPASGITKTQIQQSLDVFGALGDLQYLIFEISGVAKKMDGDIDRSEQRKFLRRKFTNTNCDINSQGVMAQGEYSLQFSGGFCPGRLDYQQLRRTLTDTANGKVELMSVNSNFASRVTDSVSEVQNFSMEGEYRNITEKTDKQTTWKKETDIKLKGKSRQLREFLYALEEKFIEIQQGETPRLAVLRRTDRFSAGTSLKLTLLKQIRYVDGKVDSSLYEQNGKTIPEADYLEIMQDLHNQWGGEAFTAP